MRVLLTGGGSGGHVNPAIAIADTIKMNQPDAQIAFVGVEGGKESDLVPRAGYPLHYVESRGFQRSLSLSNIKALATAIHSPYSKNTKEILETFRPDIVIGTGGYVCWPLLCAASRAGIPTMVHESNCKPGVAVKMLQYKVDTILLNFKETREQLHCRKKCVVVGNPLRGGFGSITYEQARAAMGLSDKELLVLISAGSLGSQSVNKAVLDMLRNVAPTYPHVHFWLSTGSKNHAEALAQYREYELSRYDNVELCEYIYDMPAKMAAADVVISRAGAMSLSELCRMGKASIIIPSPFVAGNHQYYNAKALEDRGAALLVEEQDFSGGALPRALLPLLEDADARRRLQRNIRAVAGDDANRLIYHLIVSAVENHQRKQSKK